MLKTYIINAQLNYPYNGYPLKATINATLTANSSLATLGEAVAIFNKHEGQKCLEFDPSYALTDPYMWLRCTEIPYPQSWSAADTIWGENGPVLDAKKNQTRTLDPWCQAAFGISSIESGSALQRHLGLDQHSLENTERLLLTLGLDDPTAGLGPSSWFPSSSRNHSRIIYVPESAHIQVMMTPDPTDSNALVESRVFVLNSLKKWLDITG